MVGKGESKPGSETAQSARGGKRRGRLLRYTLATLGLLSLLVMGAAIWAGFYVTRISETLPDPQALEKLREARPSVLLSGNGTHLATFNRGYFLPVTIDQVSPHVIDALIATEDHRFFTHGGVDIERTLGAIWYTLQGKPQGGSTLTQQLVRNAFPERVGRERTIERKLREMLMALEVEKVYSKEQIIELYLNAAPFLYQVRGIEMAARTYFDKSAHQLDILESATLVGMLKGTSYYNPVLHPERARHRRNVVLAQMMRHGKLNPEAYQQLRQQSLELRFTRPTQPLGPAPHFTAHVRTQLQQWAQANGFDLYTDGLVIHSTLDDRLQQAAAEAVRRQAEVLQNIADVEWAQPDDRVISRSPEVYGKLREKVEPFGSFWDERPGLLQTLIRESPEFRRAVSNGTSEADALAQLSADAEFVARLRTRKTRLEAGFVAIDPDTGAVRAWVGSRDFGRDQFDHVALARRQPGSTFKPFVYAAALEHGLHPDLLYPDGQVEIPLDNGRVWSPKDMAGFTNQLMTMREGLVFSKNTITAQVMQDVGVQHVAAMARAAGIRQSPLHQVPSLSLGTSPVSLLEMVSAYATFARAGAYRPPRMISHITDRNGSVLALFGDEPEYVMSEDTAIDVLDMLRGVVREGTGREVRTRFGLNADLAGKTGTTQYNTDGWFILMHPRLVGGAWVGFNDQRVTMRSDYWGQGGHNAVLLVGDFFRTLFDEGLLDKTPRFPQSKRPPPLHVRGPVGGDERVVRGIDLLSPDDLPPSVQQHSGLTSGGGHSEPVWRVEPSGEIRFGTSGTVTD